MKKDLCKEILEIVESSKPIFFCSSKSNVMTKGEHRAQENGMYEMKVAISQNIEHYFYPEVPPYNKLA